MNHTLTNGLFLGHSGHDACAQLGGFGDAGDGAYTKRLSLDATMGRGVRWIQESTHALRA